MQFNRIITLGLVVGLMAFLPPAAFSQVLYGSLVGTVTDPSAAAVPGAVVRSVNQETGQSRTTTTGDSGAYAFPSLIPGRYVIEVSAEGFGPFRSQAAEVTINTVVRVDAGLQLGQVGESVSVSASAVTLETERGDVHSEISAREATELPVSGYRNFQSLIDLVPGASPASYQNAVIGSPARALATNVNGTTNNNSNTRLDGASNMRASLPHQILYVPPIESIESVSISTNSFDAEQGFVGGAAVNIATKSGTNQLHGVLFEHHSNSAMFARNFFFKPGQRIPKNIINIYGGTLGGPIRKDRLFYFVSWEGMRERTNNSGLYSVPTESQRGGDFSSFSASIYDPLTGAADGTGRAPFAKNLIPAQRISGISRKLQALLPLPNLAGVASNYFASASALFDRDNFDGKLNWNLSPSTTVWAKYSTMRAVVTSQPALGAAGGEGLINGGGTGTGYVLSEVGTVGAVKVVRPDLVLDGTVAFSHDPLDFVGHDYGTNAGLELGIPGTNGPDPRQSGMPQFAITGYSSFGNVYAFQPKLVDNLYFTGSTNGSWTLGKHAFRFGYDITHYGLSEWHPERGQGPRGGFGFAGGVTALRGGAAPGQFNSYAQFLLGLQSTSGKSLQVYDATIQQWMHGLYFRDRWQISRRVTLSLGVRWEYFPLMTRDHGGVERYDWTTNLVTIGGLGGIPRNNGITTSKRLFSPRLGLAWRVTGRSVLRTGYGISVDPFLMTTAESLLFPYPVVVAQDFSAASSYEPVGSLETGLPAVSTPDLSKGVSVLPANVSTNTTEAGPLHRGYIHSYNLAFERELPGGFIASAGYVGTHTVRQMVDRDINAAPVNGGNAGRPLFAAFGRIASTLVISPAASASYNSLQAKLNRNLGSGAMVRVAYTWSKAMNMTDASVGSLLFNNSEVLSRNRALAGYDRTHNLRTAVVYSPPFGKDRRLLRDSRIGSALLSGWQLSGILSLFSGAPFTVTASGASLNAPGNTQTADQVLVEVERLGGIGPSARYFDPAAFASVTAVRYGNTGRNILRGPGTANLDATLARNFTLAERWKLQFRAESYNVTNTPSFNNPNANVSTPASFMTITSARSRSGSITGGERAFRLGLRFSF